MELRGRRPCDLRAATPTANAETHAGTPANTDDGHAVRTLVRICESARECVSESLLPRPPVDRRLILAVRENHRAQLCRGSRARAMGRAPACDDDPVPSLLGLELSVETRSYGDMGCPMRRLIARMAAVVLAATLVVPATSHASAGASALVIGDSITVRSAGDLGRDGILTSAQVGR